MSVDDNKLTKMLDALEMADRDAKGKARPCRGELVCPLCGGKLHYHYGSRKKEFRMSCETPDCIRAMS